ADFPAGADQDDRRHRPDAERLCAVGLGVDVDRDHLVLTAILGLERGEDRRDGPTWAAPRGREIENGDCRHAWTGVGRAGHYSPQRTAGPSAARDHPRACRAFAMVLTLQTPVAREARVGTFDSVAWHPVEADKAATHIA